MAGHPVPGMKASLYSLVSFSRDGAKKLSLGRAGFAFLAARPLPRPEPLALPFFLTSFFSFSGLLAASS